MDLLNVKRIKMPLKLGKFLRLRPERVNMSSSKGTKDTNVTTRTKPRQKSVPEMKESKSENSGINSRQKAAIQKKPVSSPLGKSSYLSKSHENLTSHQKNKLLAAHSRPNSSLGLPAGKRTVSNKENVNIKDKPNDGFLKPKPVKPVKPGCTSTPIRKASSSQHIDKTGGSDSLKAPTGKSVNMKRAHSTQNVSKDSKLLKKRTSTTTPVDVMAYNAELLANFEREKKVWETRVSEQIQVAENRKMEIEKYKYEIKNLKEKVPSTEEVEEVEILRSRCEAFREQLIKLGFPVDQQITDAEKLSIIQHNEAARKDNDAFMRTSASCDSLSADERVSMTAMQSLLGSGMKRSASVTMSEPGMPLLSSLDMHGKWDSRSKSSDALSDISVVGLTERIMQMEETHYSTNEELQATLQELGDLQDAVNDLTEENERLADQNSVLLESLCAQTEKLEHCRTQIEQLKCLLISGDLPNKSDREQHLLELLKGAQEEREEMLTRQDELVNALNSGKNESRELQDQCDALKDKNHLQEDKISSIKTERDNIEKQNVLLKESLANEQIEKAHFKTLLENEKTKVKELEDYCKAAEQSDLEELLHNTRQEKDKLEERLVNSQDTLAHSLNEVTKVRDQNEILKEEVTVARKNAKSQVCDMEYKVERINKDRYDMQKETDALREHIDQLEQDCDRYMGEKKNFVAQIQELQGEVSVMRQLKIVAETELQDIRIKHEAEIDDWKQFQKDLQVAVVIANDFRSETQVDMDKLTNDNQTMTDKCQALQAEIDKLKTELDSVKIQEKAAAFNSPKSTILSSAELKGKVLSTVDKDLVHLREGKHGEKTQSLSVKNLIRSIEVQVKSGRSSINSSSCSSRRNSDPDLSIHDFMKSPSSPVSEPGLLSPENSSFTLRSVLKRSAERPSPHQRHSIGVIPFDGPNSPSESPKSAPPISRTDAPQSLSSILSNRTPARRSSGATMDSPSDRKEGATKDPLAGLTKLFKGSKRNALLKWCQQKTVTYSNVDITNFSSSWNDGLAFCALLHNYLPDKVPYTELTTDDKRRNFTLAFSAGDSVGIPSILCISDMVAMERPDWQAVFAYVTSIYKHFEVDNKS